MKLFFVFITKERKREKEREREREKETFFILLMCVHICMYVRACVCACMRVYSTLSKSIRPLYFFYLSRILLSILFPIIGITTWNNRMYNKFHKSIFEQKR